MNAKIIKHALNELKFTKRKALFFFVFSLFFLNLGMIIYVAINENLKSQHDQQYELRMAQDLTHIALQMHKSKGPRIDVKAIPYNAEITHYYGNEEGESIEDVDFKSILIERYKLFGNNYKLRFVDNLVFELN